MDRAIDTRLSVAEISALWMQYMSESMAECVLNHFLATAEDTQIKGALSSALDSSVRHLRAITHFLEQTGIPRPVGFSAHDIDIAAPRLFSDIFYLYYLRRMTQIAMIDYSCSAVLAAQTDVRSYIYHCLNESSELHERVITLAITKGIHIRPPYLAVPDRVEFAQSQRFLGTLIGKQRPLQVVEVAHLFANIEAISIGKILLTGFAQVANHPKIRDIFLQAKDTLSKQVETLNRKLAKEDIPTPMHWDSGLTNSITAPFSDKLMLQHTLLIAGAALGRYGLALGASARADIITDYTRNMAEIALFMEDGMNLLIDHGWFEVCPQVTDRNELATSH